MSLKTTEFVANNNRVIICPYLLDLAPCDVAWFPKLTMKLKGRFETVSDIQRELQALFDRMKANDFHSVLGAWKKRWDHCIHSQGDYFEGMAAKIE
jgi:hypothetical protein